MRTVYIDTAGIVSRPSFHREFQHALGFPAFYGANMDAWIDCMSAIDDPDSGLTQVTVKHRELLLLEIPDALELAARCPDIYQDLLECTVVVNQRRVQAGEPPVLTLLLR